MRVLIVEDELIVAWNLRMIFEGMGMEVLAVAMTAEEAIGQARSGAPDLILMDIRLKGGATGIDAASEIRRFSEVPIAYVTGNEHLLSSEQILATRPIGVYPKPTTERDLADMVRKAGEGSAGDEPPP
jgi:DNA-binding NarL/FixJ family response regulator